ncbi:hypothetical protein FPOA_05943 [Fusarium poae]|uniref:Uncharacterized protein n=1 Tax=Fusarium poae TaxID=36050 RepID=A0A1B8AY32_FUSPO|nr:hypothetical protein FPOA_05943 [Fusarium poae]
MGGKAFSHSDPPLETPRMPKEVYLEVKNKVIRALTPAFGWIDSPIEGPGKNDFGDIDIIVSGLIGDDMRKESILTLINHLLEAEAQITEPGSAVAAHFAIPWPKHLPQPATHDPLQDDDSNELESSATPIGNISPAGTSSSDLSRPQSAAPENPESNAEPLTLKELRDKGRKILPHSVARQTGLAVALMADSPDSELGSPSPEGTFSPSPDSGKQRKSSWSAKGKKLFIPRSRSFSSFSNLISKLGQSSWNSEDSSSDEDDKNKGTSPDSITNDKSGFYIQVDIHYCDTVKQAKYLRFHQAHGDIWQLLGSVIKPFGLTVDNVGLWIRIPEVELIDKKRAKILLTSVPNQILDFVGVSSTEYWRPFSDVDAMFGYISQSPMFYVPSDYSEDYEMTSAKSNDRQRLAKRPVYAQWIHAFKPLCRSKGFYSKALTTREDVRNKAFETFKIETEYHQRLRDFLFEKQKNEIIKEIKNIFPGPAQPTNQKAIQMRALHIKAMKEIIIECVDASRYNIVAPKGVRLPNGLFNMDRVRAFARTIENDGGAKPSRVGTPGLSRPRFLLFGTGFLEGPRLPLGRGVSRTGALPTTAELLRGRAPGSGVSQRTLRHFGPIEGVTDLQASKVLISFFLNDICV